MEEETTQKTISRTIQFHQIQWVTCESDREGNDVIVTKNQDFFESVLSSHMNTIYPRNEDYSVILEKNDLNEVPNGFFGKISKIRTSAFPQKYIISENKPESLGLGDDEGLYEPCHFSVFEGQILINEFNSYGSRVSTIKSIINKYLKENPVDNIKEIRIHPILRTDPVTTINNFIEMRSIEFVVATDYAKKWKDESNSFKTMFASEEFVEEMFLTISFNLGRLRPHDPMSKFHKVIDFTKQLVQKDDFTDGVRSLKIYGKMDGEEYLAPVNLAEQVFKTKRKIAKINNETKAVDSDEMYKELASSFIAHKDEIKNYIKEEE